MALQKKKVLLLACVVLGLSFGAKKSFNSLTEMINAKEVTEIKYESSFPKKFSKKTLDVINSYPELSPDLPIYVGNLDEEESFCQLAEEHDFKENIIYLINDYHIENQYGGIAFSNGVYLKVDDVLEKNEDYTKVKISFYYLPSIENNIPEKVGNEFSNMSDKLDEIVSDSGALKEKNLRDRVLTMEKYFAENYSYDTNSSSSNMEDYMQCSTLPHILDTKKGNCRAFSTLAYRLFKKLGVENYVVYLCDSDMQPVRMEKSKKTKTYELHACNRVKVENNEYETVETTMSTNKGYSRLKAKDPFSIFYSYRTSLRDIRMKPEKNTVQIKPNEYVK